MPLNDTDKAVCRAIARTMHAFAPELLQTRARLRKAQADRRALAEVLRLSGPSARAVAHIHTPEDAEVLALCERVGFGAVMDSAARQWAARDPVAAHTHGACRKTVDDALRAHAPRRRKPC